MKRLLIALVAVGAAVTAADSPALADAPQNSHNCGGLGEQRRDTRLCRGWAQGSYTSTRARSGLEAGFVQEYNDTFANCGSTP